MNNQLKRLLIGLLFLAGLALVITALRPTREAPGAPSSATNYPTSVARQARDASEAAGEANRAPVASPSPIATPAPGEPPLRAMLSLLAEMTKPGRRLTDLVSYLESSGQKPFIVDNKNEFTGEMTIVRTKSPFPNTRYFHAQFFSDDGGPFLQHLSFEYKASPTALAEALQTVREVFPGLGKPMHETPGFTQWAVEDGYVVWCKKLEKEDLVGNPFNAYSSEDLGTVRCAVELNPHPHDE